MTTGSSSRHKTSSAVRTTRTADEGAAINTIVLAFSSDPMARWCWPSADQYLVSMPALARAFGGNAFLHDSAHCSDDHAAAALWLPPGVEPDEHAMLELIEHTVAPSLQADLFGVLEQMGAYHPEEPHWYLPLIGVDPAHQGKGYGSALLQYALEKCDRDRMKAYLESTNPRNVPLYERYGFEAIGTIQVGSSPPLVPMTRRSR